jgi:metal-responsive CopG/Arc/MetJ family transcriptional regulator
MVEVDERLLTLARGTSRHATDAELVSAALRAYIQHRQRLEVLELAGTIDYAEDYDYKALRRRG